MGNFRHGLEVEDRLRTKLRTYGCTVTDSLDLDHQYKIDFAITRFPEQPSFFSIGVQVTTKLDDADKLETFFKLHERVRVTEKIVYLEISQQVDLDMGGAFTVFAAMLEVRLNALYRNIRIVGVRVLSDISYEVFEIPQVISKLRQRGVAQPLKAVPPRPQPANIDVPVGQKLEGRIESYHRKRGFGFIRAKGRRFYFHVSNVTDAALSARLNALPNSGDLATLDVPVDFVNAGHTGKDSKLPEAREVCAHDRSIER